MVRPVFQETLFQPWREVLPLPSPAAAVGDKQSQMVWGEVVPRVVRETTLMEVVTLIMTALLHGMF